MAQLCSCGCCLFSAPLAPAHPPECGSPGGGGGCGAFFRGAPVRPRAPLNLQPFLLGPTGLSASPLELWFPSHRLWAQPALARVSPDITQTRMAASARGHQGAASMTLASPRAPQDPLVYAWTPLPPPQTLPSVLRALLPSELSQPPPRKLTGTLLRGL